ncbi:rhamnogalacturonan acetylesterase [Sphingobacterium gobiense]|uniref:GntR family transcriptional regulator n=1 Tax=Sphingobacterium gobiense TaxID=1382456 RepID=A0A2S9JNT4_9SPHI|nr:rhamnogalacturonan acetylesterase [Sphingobacterium gobiense]PRD54756.1 GntR family transcriptional regulator [Sphingobacterium gobiense]
MCKKNILWSLNGILVLGVLCSFIIQPRKKNIWMIGDSTMAIKAPDKFPETGWGVAFAEMFGSDVDVLNKAKNGRSTKSCIREGIWKEVSDGLKQGDYVFIQFGHNDEKVHKPNTGTIIDEYKANLSLFVTEARSKGAEPILLTPIARRAFEDGKLVDTHGAYPDAVRTVADSLHVPLIDMTQQTSELLTELGEEKSARLFLHLPEGHINYPKGVIDNTHLNERGAETIATLVARELERQRMPLAKDLKKKK